MTVVRQYPAPAIQPGQFKIQDVARSLATVTCAECKTVVCDVDPGDDLYILADLAAEHRSARHPVQGAGKSAAQG